jgi:hypothetical protein
VIKKLLEVLSIRGGSRPGIHRQGMEWNGTLSVVQMEAKVMAKAT